MTQLISEQFPHLFSVAVLVQCNRNRLLQRSLSCTYRTKCFSHKPHSSPSQLVYSLNSILNSKSRHVQFFCAVGTTKLSPFPLGFVFCSTNYEGSYKHSGRQKGLTSPTTALVETENPETGPSSPAVAFVDISKLVFQHPGFLIGDCYGFRW